MIERVASARQPSISVIIPSFNSRETIVTCLDSVRVQTLQPFEVLVVDDASSDDTFDVVTAWKSRTGDQRVRVIRSAQNGGPGVARNKGICESRGDVLAFLDADDSWRDRHLEVALHVLTSAGPSSAVVVHRPVGVGDDVGAESPQDAVRWRAFSLMDYLMVQRNSSIITLVAAKDDVLAAGLFPESRKHAEDFEFCIRLFAQCSQRYCVETPRTAVIGKHAYASRLGLSSQSWQMYVGSLRALRNAVPGTRYAVMLPLLWAWHTAKYARRLMQGAF